jgi:hypothetical protein
MTTGAGFRRCIHQGSLVPYRFVLAVQRLKYRPHLTFSLHVDYSSSFVFIVADSFAISSKPALQ